MTVADNGQGIEGSDSLPVEDLDEIVEQMGSVIEGVETVLKDVEARRHVPKERLEEVMKDVEALNELLPDDEDEPGP